MVIHIGMVTNVERYQHLLPQIILGANSKFTLKLMRSLGKIRHSVDFVRAKSAWVNTAVMMNVLSRLKDSLAHIPNSQVILLLDSHKAHLNKNVLELAVSLNIWVLVVPAKLTWLLQPLDAHVFAKYKKYLRDQLRTTMLANRTVTDPEWMKMLISVATTFIQRDWGNAFDSLGITGKPGTLSETIKSYCPQASSAAVAAPSMPSYGDISAVLPCNLRSPPYRLLMAGPRGARKRLVIR